MLVEVVDGQMRPLIDELLASAAGAMPRLSAQLPRKRSNMSFGSGPAMSAPCIEIERSSGKGDLVL